MITVPEVVQRDQNREHLILGIMNEWGIPLTNVDSEFASNSQGIKTVAERHSHGMARVREVGNSFLYDEHQISQYVEEWKIKLGR